jgi:hypothetical protein
VGVVVAADTVAAAAVMVEAASGVVMEAASAEEVFTEVAWAAEVSMEASPVAAFAEAVHVSQAEALEVATAMAEATAMVEAMVMADMMTGTESPEVFLPVH